MLITLLLFNWLGYRLVTGYLQQHADQQLEARIDAHHYDDAELIEIKVALNLPYQSVNTSFERHYGEMEIDGKYYTYVKRKIEDGYLVLKCIPNHGKESINNSANTYFKTTNGIGGDQEKASSSPSVKIVKTFTADFDNDQLLVKLSYPAVQTIHPSAISPAALAAGFTTSAERPPSAALHA